MANLDKHISSEELSKVFLVYEKQPWVTEREDSLSELLQTCETPEHKSLILELLLDFKFLNQKALSGYLFDIANYIILKSGFKESTTQLTAITYDDEADSSQKILDYIKIPMYLEGWDDVKTVNHYSSAMKNFKKGRNQIILIDEFIGSGQTIIGRIKQLKNDIKEEFQLKLCFIAGMDYALKWLEEEGYEVFCPLRLAKGITEKYKEEELEDAIKKMKFLEQSLAQKINDFDLSNYSFGFNSAEALYSLQGCNGNTPNSVFPIFWWPRTKEDAKRKTLLTRFERGLK